MAPGGVARVDQSTRSDRVKARASREVQPEHVVDVEVARQVRRVDQRSVDPEVVEDHVVEAIAPIPAPDLTQVLLRPLQGNVLEDDVVSVPQRWVDRVWTPERVDGIFE